jgi:hypothetical protein
MNESAGRCLSRNRKPELNPSKGSPRSFCKACAGLVVEPAALIVEIKGLIISWLQLLSIL